MEIKAIDIALEKLPTGESLGFRGTQYIYSRDTGAPRVLVTGGVHGDEPTGTAALWYLQERLAQASLQGLVTVVPAVNVLALQAGSRLIPHEDSDLNRTFPGRHDGSLAERLAAALVKLGEDHDALIDVHTAGWCVPFVLLDHSPDAELLSRVITWVAAGSLPVIGEMPSEHSSLQGLDRSWSAWAMATSKKPAFTLELVGYRTLDSECAKNAADWLLEYIKAFSRSSAATNSSSALPFRLETYANTSGLFEAFRRPGDSVKSGDAIGKIRGFDGTLHENILASCNGLLLALQPVSAVHVGSWLATIATTPDEQANEHRGKP